MSRPFPPLCGAVAKCAAGSYYTAKAGDVDAKCTACPAGSFNAADDQSTECTPHNACSATGVKTAGDTAKDSICKEGMLQRHPPNSDAEML